MPPNPSPTDQVMVLLDREEAENFLPETLGSWAKVRAARTKLRSALSQEVEERREYKVIYDVHAYGSEIGTYEILLADSSSLAEAQQRAEVTRPSRQNVRIQVRTTYTYKDGSQLVTAWVDLEEGS